MPDEKIIISMPYYDMIVGASAHTMVNLRTDPRVIDHTFAQGMPVGHVRNQIVLQCLERDDWTHLLMIDSDNYIKHHPQEVIDMLLACDSDIACGWYDLLLGDGTNLAIVRSVMTKSGRWETNELPIEPFDVICCGAGCILMTREALEKTPCPWFKWSGNYLADPENESDDIFFCKKALSLNLTIRCHPELKLGHEKRIPLDLLHEARQIGANYGV